MKKKKIKDRIRTNSFRTIKKNFPRFLSLMVMSMLGVMVFTGLQATAPDMVNTLDNYYDDGNIYDIKIFSTLGLTNNDLKVLEKEPTVKDVESSYEKDVLIKETDKEYVIRLTEIPKKINQITLIDGRMPLKDDEIVIEKNFLTETKYKIGDKIKISDEDLNKNELTIVGTVNSPMYINSTSFKQSRGMTNIASGVVHFYAFAKKELYNQDYYNNIYITVKDAKEKRTSTKPYLNIIEKSKNDLDSIRNSQELERYNSIKNDAQNKIDEEKRKGQEKLDDAKKDLDKAKRDLDKAKKDLNKGKKDLNYFKNELDKAKRDLENGKKQYQDSLKKYNVNEKDIPNNISKLKGGITKLEQVLATIPPTIPEYAEYQKQLATLKIQLKGLEELEKAKITIENGEKAYNTNYKKYLDSEKTYNKGQSSYNNGLKKYQDGEKEYNKNKDKFDREISQAELDLKNLKKPTWYINDRGDDETYQEYINQTKSIKNLSFAFPIVFYLVAILVSLVSMNRMVEEDRGEIGTLKSLGFANKDILRKYTNFSSFATIVGSLLGTILGLTGIPYLIYVIYTLLFDVPNFSFGLNLPMTITSIVIALICITGASILTTLKVLKEKPAILMRPKPPESGKNILLEKVTFIWKRLKFSNKITIRNIFRYKKRVLITVLGITGCTALMLCGFGIKDSIVDITDVQYNKTNIFDAIAYLNDANKEDLEIATKDDLIKDFVLTENINATVDNSKVSMVVAENNEELERVVNKITPEGKEVKLEKGKVIITDKLAEIKNLKVGDKITLLDTYKKEYTFEISSIVKNYIGHSIYLDKETLGKFKNYEPNMMYIHTTKDLTDKEKKALSKKLLGNEEIINIIYKKDMENSTHDMLQSLDKIIVVLITLAACLSFVVLYNLSNINIAERKREIASLKVLGFYNKEVDNYITKENTIFTILGIIFGLIFGTLLTYYVIGTVEMEDIRFLRVVAPKSYLYSGVIALIFTFIINIVTHFSLKKIDMIESLKSVE